MTASTWPRLERMLRGRRFDERLIDVRERVTGVFHVGIGQEATAAAIAAVREPDDVLMLNHRSHQHLAANGTDLAPMFAEILGRDLGPLRGRGGTLHLCDADRGVPYTSSMVGGGVPVGLGVALAKRRRGEPGIAICCFGDGALGEGVLHECFNIARLWDLPVLFVCESNSAPAAGQATASQSAGALTDLPQAHRVPASRADATDPSAIDDAVRTAVAAIRGGGGPRFVLAQTAPWPGNATFLPTNPLGRVELSRAERPDHEWDAHDPILNEVRALRRDGADPEALRTLDARVAAEVEDALRAALDAPPAPASVAFENVRASA